MPSLMTSVLLLSIFFCTPAQKVQIGVVVLLSFRIFLLNVAGNIPKTSDHVPLLGEPRLFSERELKFIVRYVIVRPSVVCRRL